MLFIDFKEAYTVQLDDQLCKFADWTQELVEIIENRVFLGTFEKTIYYLMSFDKELITRITDEQLEEQLTFCSQHKFEFKQLATELELYRERIDRYFKVWLAGKCNQVRKDLLEGQRKEVEDKLRTKANYDSLSRDIIMNCVMEEHKQQYLVWQDFLEKVNRAQKFLSNIVSDIEHRSFILMSLGKRRQY